MNTLNKSIQPRGAKLEYRVIAINKSGEGSGERDNLRLVQ